MNKRIIVTGIVTLLVATAAPVFAEAENNTARIEKLEERTRDLEARLAKVEASAHKQMGMMQHDHAMKEQGMNNPMGQVPQQNPGMNGAAPQQPGAGMPAGGAPMGDM